MSYTAESYKLQHVADVIKDPAGSRIVWLGDSTGVTSNSPRWGMSIARSWDIPIAGRTFYAFDSASLDNAYITFQKPGSIAAVGDIIDGFAVPPGFTARWRTWTGNSDFNPTIRAAGTLVDYKQGHPLAGQTYRTNVAVLGTATPWERYFLDYADSSGAAEVDMGLRYWNVVSNGLWQKISMATYSGDMTDRTSLGLSAKTSNSENETGKYFTVGGWEWEAVGKAGLTYGSISVGGYGAIDHAEVGTNPSSAYSFAERKNKFDVFGWPDVIAIQLGINKVNAAQALTTWGDEIRHILDWHVTLYNDNLHTPPKFMLVVPWENTGGGASVQEILDNEAKTLVAICDERTDCGMLNLYRRMLNVHGPYTGWQGTYLADSTHQNVAGAIEFGKQSWEVIEGNTTPAYEDLIQEAPGAYMMQDSDVSTDIVNENGTAASLNGSGNTVDSSVEGPTAWLPRAIRFDGSDDYVDCGNHSVSADGIFTLAMWYKSSSSVVSCPISEASSLANPPLVGFRLDGAETRSWTRNDANVGGFATTGVTTDGNWHLVVQTCNGSRNSLYVDGVFMADFTMPDTPFSVNKSTIGALGRSTASSFFDGDIAGVIFSNRAWTYGDIQSYLAGPIGSSIDNYIFNSGLSFGEVIAGVTIGVSTSGTTESVIDQSFGDYSYFTILDGSIILQDSSPKNLYNIRVDSTEYIIRASEIAGGVLQITGPDLNNASIMIGLNTFTSTAGPSNLDTNTTYLNNRFKGSANKEFKNINSSDYIQ